MSFCNYQHSGVFLVLHCWCKHYSAQNPQVVFEKKLPPKEGCIFHKCATTAAGNDRTALGPNVGECGSRVMYWLFPLWIENNRIWISLSPYSLFSNSLVSWGRKIIAVEEWNILHSDILILLVLKNQNKKIMWWMYYHSG